MRRILARLAPLGALLALWPMSALAAGWFLATQPPLMMPAPGNGSLAIAGVPRGTADVDVNVFVPEPRVPDVIAVLAKLGIEIPESAIEDARVRGMFVGRWSGMRIDVLIMEVFDKTTRSTPKSVIERCKRRLRTWDEEA